MSFRIGPGSPQDIWCQWLLNRRFGGDQAALHAALTDHLYPWRDNVLKHANLQPGDTLLDVGCGDGLIAFGALERVETSQVIFSDVSTDVLEYAQSLAQQMKVLSRCRFVLAPADDLSQIDASSMDAVTTRSVLIYVSAKQQAFNEFYRVLKPRGRLSIFEPIGRYAHPEPASTFAGYGIGPVVEIAQKLKALYDRIQPPEVDPMIDFDGSAFCIVRATPKCPPLTRPCSKLLRLRKPILSPRICARSSSKDMGPENPLWLIFGPPNDARSRRFPRICARDARTAKEKRRKPA